MELKIDLLKNCETPISYIAMGVICIVIAVLVAVMGNNTLFWICFGGMGLNFIAIGLGFSMDRLFGKAYISIDSDLISLKADIYHKAQSIYWNEIKSIDYKTHQVIIEKIDNTTVILNLSKFSYPLKREIKETIDCIAKEKKIQSTI
jgi:hypothetical protein